MKDFTVYISEKLKITKKMLSPKETLTPKTKNDLIIMIIHEVQSVDESGLLDLNHIDISNVDNLNSVFHQKHFPDNEIMLNIDISSWNLDHINDMEFLFYNDKINSVILPDTKKLDEYLFHNCRNLTEAILPASLTEIDNYFMDYCDKLKTIEIPDSVTKIGCSAFRNCSSLTSITLPDSITNMREGVFSNCENLKSIKLSKQLKSLEYDMFLYCSNLEEVYLQNNIKNIETNVFDSCKKLTKIHYDATMSEWCKIKLDNNWLEYSNVKEIICNDGTINC